MLHGFVCGARVGTGLMIVTLAFFSFVIDLHGCMILSLFALLCLMDRLAKYKYVQCSYSVALSSSSILSELISCE